MISSDSKLKNKIIWSSYLSKTHIKTFETSSSTLTCKKNSKYKFLELFSNNMLHPFIIIIGFVSF